MINHMFVSELSPEVDYHGERLTKIGTRAWLNGEYVIPSYLGEVLLAVVAMATACLHQASSGHPICIQGGYHSDTTVALLHYHPQQHSGVDGVVRSDSGDGDTNAIHWNK